MELYRVWIRMWRTHILWFAPLGFYYPFICNGTHYDPHTIYWISDSQDCRCNWDTLGLLWQYNPESPCALQFWQIKSKKVTNSQRLLRIFTYMYFYIRSLHHHYHFGASAWPQFSSPVNPTPMYSPKNCSSSLFIGMSKIVVVQVRHRSSQAPPSLQAEPVTVMSNAPILHRWWGINGLKQVHCSQYPSSNSCLSGHHYRALRYSSEQKDCYASDVHAWSEQFGHHCTMHDLQTRIKESWNVSLAKLYQVRRNVDYIIIVK